MIVIRKYLQVFGSTIAPGAGVPGVFQVTDVLLFGFILLFKKMVETKEG